MKLNYRELKLVVQNDSKLIHKLIRHEGQSQRERARKAQVAFCLAAPRVRCINWYFVRRTKFWASRTSLTLKWGVYKAMTLLHVENYLNYMESVYCIALLEQSSR